MLPNHHLSRDDLRDIAISTLQALDEGEYFPSGAVDPYDLTMKIQWTEDNTRYYGPDAGEGGEILEISIPPNLFPEAMVCIGEYSTLVAARKVYVALASNPNPFSNKKIGVLNFASAKKPGGGFINGSQGQERSIARVSTLYPSLITPAALPFYTHYRNDPSNAYYTHAMVYSPGVVLLRDDNGEWRSPVEVDVLTSAPVNAGEIRRGEKEKEIAYIRRLQNAEYQIQHTMYTRISRILHLFQLHQIPYLILGSFGTGVFQNHTDLVATIFAELLVKPGGRFKNVFKTIVFAILGKETVRVFENVFSRVEKRAKRMRGETGGSCVLLDEDGSDGDVREGAEERMRRMMRWEARRTALAETAQA
ncbi:hypothetical protein BYT27DRAFT_7112061 [Phlegmacium glaucopus]|nr:hypothetical protein BYT27DRAFT_7112061 [Phlegmacium glaucopus]